MTSFPDIRILFQLLLLLVPAAGWAQTPVEGYVFETNNGGFINQATVAIYKLQGNKMLDTLETDEYGHFAVNLPPGKYRISTRKDIFEARLDTIAVQNSKLFLKIEMNRKQGYLLDVKIMDAGFSTETTAKGLSGTTIEVYNRTSDQVESVYRLKTSFSFQQNVKQGNHYTILVRKPGFIGKRIEVDVNTNGCEFCLDGFSNYRKNGETRIIAGEKVTPILADISLEQSVPGKHLPIPVIFTGDKNGRLDKDRPEVVAQLKKVANMMKDNPDLSFELAVHSDARGNDSANLERTLRQAEAVKTYLIGQGVVPERITAKGYGETQLINKCGNDVECTEEEHAQNRRTELVITHILPEYIWLPIEQIVEEEKIAERARSEQYQKVEMEKPATFKPKTRKLPEANQSVPTPEFQGNKKTKN